MGLFSLFVKSPEDIEKKGDKLVLDEMYGPGRTEYGKALGKLEGKRDQGEIIARIEKKYAGCGEYLARQHLATAAELHEAGIDAEAHHLLFLAGKLAIEEETKSGIASLLGDLKSSMAEEGEEWEEDEVEEEAYSDDDLEFEALCMSLSEDQGDAYMDYGDAFRQGFIALNAGRFADAESLLDQALLEHGDESYVPLELAASCHNQGKNEKAEGLLKGFLAHHRFHTHGVEVLCHLYLEGGAPEKAMTVLEENLSGMDEKPVELILLKGRLFIALGNPKDAEYWLTDHLDGAWDDNIAFFLASIRMTAGDTAGAKTLLEGSMGRCTGCGRRPPSHIQLAYADILKEEGDTSSNLMERYLKLAMDDPSTAPRAYGAVGEIYKAKGNDAEAERYAKMSQ